MPDPSFVILYVDNPMTSAAFYQELLERAPVETAPTFVAFALPSGLTLGLMSRHTVEPAAQAAAGGGELAFAVADKAAVQAVYETWVKRGLRVAKKPIDLEFGHTFIALDPDGHRLRVFAPPTS